MHISETSIDILDTFVLFHMLAEGTMTQLHVCEFILILNEELATILTHVYCHVWYNVLEVPFRVVRVEVTVV